MLIVGHNPSVKTWEVGVAYGNPSNRFWGLLRSSGILPAKWRPDEGLSVVNNRMPYELGACVYLVINACLLSLVCVCVCVRARVKTMLKNAE